MIETIQTQQPTITGWKARKLQQQGEAIPTETVDATRIHGTIDEIEVSPRGVVYLIIDGEKVAGDTIHRDAAGHVFQVEAGMRFDGTTTKPALNDVWTFPSYEITR